MVAFFQYKNIKSRLVLSIIFELSQLKYLWSCYLAIILNLLRFWVAIFHFFFISSRKNPSVDSQHDFFPPQYHYYEILHFPCVNLHVPKVFTCFYSQETSQGWKEWNRYKIYFSWWHLLPELIHCPQIKRKLIPGLTAPSPGSRREMLWYKTFRKIVQVLKYCSFNKFPWNHENIERERRVIS